MFYLYSSILILAVFAIDYKLCLEEDVVAIYLFAASLELQIMGPPLSDITVYYSGQLINDAPDDWEF